MRRETTRGGRGWLYAILVAICLVLIFYYGSKLAEKPRVVYRDTRTTVLRVSTMPKVAERIATDNIPLAIEPLDQVLASQTWTEYRSDYASSIAMIEPPAGVKLMAPVSLTHEDPFLPQSYGRDPLKLASDAAQEFQVSAAMISAKRGPSSIELNREPPTIAMSIPPGSRKSWPRSPHMKNLLEETIRNTEAAGVEPAAKLVTRVSSSLESLVEQELKDPQSRVEIESLRIAGKECVELAGAIAPTHRELASTLVRLAYAIERRTVVWQAIHDCVVRGEELVSLRKHFVDSQRVLERIAVLEKALAKTGDIQNWKNYLMLSEVQQLASNGITGDEKQVAIAREFLARVLNTGTSEAQRAVLTSPEVHKLADLLHPLTIGPVDYSRVLADIETLEIEPTHRSNRSLAEAIQSLRFSEHPEQAAISHAIAAHYRNANIRIAVSEQLINRLLPEQTHTQKPVRQTILGADTRGASQIATQLQVDVQPDPAGWKIDLLLKGDISSNTRSSRNGATFYNTSQANVKSVREIQIRPTGFHVDGQPATVQSNDSLKKFSTDWDGLPLLGDVIRNIAHQEFVDKRPIAKRIMHSTIAKETDKEFDKQLQTRLQDSQEQLQSRLISPLEGLDLHPMIIDMQSTETRLIVRYRVASDTQIGAHTVRPIAPSDSLLSMQIHQSALNNIASQIATSDKAWSAQELADQISDLLQQPRFEITDEQASDVRVTFHPNNPISFEFDEGKMSITLRIDSLEQPGRIHLKNFVIRTSYNPIVQGLQASLERDGVISVDGTKLTSISSRDRIALRAIFSKILSNQGAVPMVAESLLSDERAAGLAVSQMELRDGWFAMAISEEASPHVAALQNHTAEGDMIRR